MLLIKLIHATYFECAAEPKHEHFLEQIYVDWTERPVTTNNLFHNNDFLELQDVPSWAGIDINLACLAVSDYETELFPDEHHQITNFAPIRKKTFSSGRACARMALLQAGIPQVALPRTNAGAVRWPPNIIGSVSHTNEWAVAAIAMQENNQAMSLGIDLERIRPMTPSVFELIGTDHEQHVFKNTTHANSYATALFSLKESIYKCLSPLYKHFISFHDVEIENLTDNHRQVKFRNTELSKYANEFELETRVSVSSDHVFTLAWLRSCEHATAKTIFSN